MGINCHKAVHVILFFGIVQVFKSQVKYFLAFMNASLGFGTTKLTWAIIG
jgi:hypothetical protein